MAPHVYANLSDPRTALSEEQDDSTFKRAYGHTMFDYLNLNSKTVGKEFGIAMAGLNAIKNPQAVLKGYMHVTNPLVVFLIDILGDQVSTGPLCPPEARSSMSEAASAVWTWRF